MTGVRLTQSTSLSQVTQQVYVGLVDNDGKRWVVKFNTADETSAFLSYATACRVDAEPSELALLKLVSGSGAELQLGGNDTVLLAGDIRAGAFACLHVDM